MALDPEDLAAIKALLAEREAKQAQDFAQLVRSTIDPLRQQVEGLKAAPAPEPPKGPKAKKRADDDVDLEDDVAVEVAKLRRMVEAEQAEKAELKEKARVEALHRSAKDALAKHGVPSDRIEHAFAFIRDRLGYAPDGEAMGFTAKNQFGDAIVHPFDEAVPNFLKSADGKLYLPPSGSAGTGTGPGRSTQPNGQPAPLADRLKGIQGRLAQSLLSN